MSSQKVSAGTTITAPPPVVFAILTDPHQHPRIDGSGSVRDLVDGPRQLEKGAEFHVSMKLFGAPYTITNRVVEFEPDRQIAWRHFAGHRWRYELEPTGDGGTFCAGADLHAIGTERMNRVAEDGDGPMGPTRMRLDKPVIAAIEGHAVAGGLELALWCDLRVAGADAVLGVFCRRWGVPLIDGGTVRLARLVGQSHALDLVLTGRPVDAAEARTMGLVNRVVDRGSARAAAEELAQQIAGHPQTCLRHDRASLLEQHELSEEGALANELRHGLVSLAADAAVGAARFASGEGRHGAPSG